MSLRRCASASKKDLNMSPGILGKKIGMTQVFRPDGQAVPVTLLKAGPCMVVQRKTPTTDGYDAVQLGLVEFIKPQRINKPTTGPSEEGRRRGREVHARVPARPGRRRPQGRRPGAGGSVQAQGQGGRHRHQQGPRVRRCGEAPPFPRRRRLARLDVPPRARFDRRIQLSFARASRACAWAATWATRG